MVTVVIVNVMDLLSINQAYFYMHAAPLVPGSVEKITLSLLKPFISAEKAA